MVVLTSECYSEASGCLMAEGTGHKDGLDAITERGPFFGVVCLALQMNVVD